MNKINLASMTSIIKTLFQVINYYVKVDNIKRFDINNCNGSSQEMVTIPTRALYMIALRCYSAGEANGMRRIFGDLENIKTKSLQHVITEDNGMVKKEYLF